MKADRLGFFSPLDRNLFFDTVKSVFKFKNWKQFREKFQLTKSNFEYYRNGQRLIPKKLFLDLLGPIPLEKKNFFASRVFIKSANWGQVIGGQKTSSLHPEFIINARSKAENRPKHDFDLNQPLSKELCEFVGAFMGDGYRYIQGRHAIIGFAGHAKLDFEYYEKTIIPIVKTLFNIQTGSIWKKENRMQVKFHSKKLSEMLTRRFKIPEGVKFDKVIIPDEILDSSSENIAAVLRGMFDTDGCVSFDKRKVYKKPYMRLHLTMYNPPILDQTIEELEKLGITASRANSKKMVQITNPVNVEKFLRKVGFSNPKHILKILKAYPDFNDYNPGTRLNSKIGA